MAKKLFKQIPLIFYFLFFCGTTLFAWSVYEKKTFKAAPLKQEEEEQELAIPDTATVHLFSQVCEQLNPQRDEFLLVGSIDAVNGADSTERLDHASYILSKKGAEFYFKLGQTEVFNLNGLNVFIDHNQKKIMLSKEKAINPSLPVPDLKMLSSKFKDEGFKVSNEQLGASQQITLSNPYHMSCKEYKLIFNASTLKPEQLSVRLSNAEEPENAKKDNKISLHITQSASRSGLEKYASRQIVEKKGLTWTLSENYSGYELISML